MILGASTVLGKVLGERVQAPAGHHQAPYHLGAGLTVAGWSPEGEVPEALVVDGHPFGVAVHWHPEEGDDHRLVEAFIAAASEPRQPVAKRPEAQLPPQPAAVKPKAAARR